MHKSVDRPNAADYVIIGNMLLGSNPNHVVVDSAGMPRAIEPNIKVQIQGEVEMASNIETVVMICGVNASTKTDDEIFELIRKLEVNMESLERISNKPNKLRAKITQIKADIDALVSYVDSRETEPVVPAVKPMGIKPLKF